MIFGCQSFLERYYLAGAALLRPYGAEILFFSEYPAKEINQHGRF
jgi:hypothetical protein